jgi:hypothetical protein
VSFSESAAELAKIISLFGSKLFLTNIGMYGPPQRCKRKFENDSGVCANVFGLNGIYWSRTTMDSARPLPIS